MVLINPETQLISQVVLKKTCFNGMGSYARQTRNCHLYLYVSIYRLPLKIIQREKQLDHFEAERQPRKQPACFRQVKRVSALPSATLELSASPRMVMPHNAQIMVTNNAIQCRYHPVSSKSIPPNIVC